MHGSVQLRHKETTDFRAFLLTKDVDPFDPLEDFRDGAAPIFKKETRRALEKVEKDIETFMRGDQWHG